MFFPDFEERLFLFLLNRGLTVSWLILAVLILRLLLKKSPKWIHCLLCIPVALRLCCPVTISSVMSLQPTGEVISYSALYDMEPVISTGIEPIDQAIAPVVAENLSAQPMNSVNPMQVMTYIGLWVMLFGTAVMLLYALVSSLRLRHRLRTAVRIRENVWLTDQIDTPFIFGILRPRIYLPCTLDEAARPSVLAHEYAHLQRRDHWWKPLGFLLLSFYWFNPLCWVAYILLCRDIESACDEKVCAKMDVSARKSYAKALLECGTEHQRKVICPLAFGENNVKNRVTAVLHYKKPAFWLIVVGVAACLAASVCFATNPPASVELPAALEARVHEDLLGNRKRPGGHVIEAHHIYGVEKHSALDGSVEYTVYMRESIGDWILVGGMPEEESGWNDLRVLTYRMNSDGTIELLENWQPLDGSEYPDSVRKKFPSHIRQKALNDARNIAEQLNEECRNQAKEAFSVEMEAYSGPKLINDTKNLASSIQEAWNVLESWLKGEYSTYEFGGFQARFYDEKLMDPKEGESFGEFWMQVQVTVPMRVSEQDAWSSVVFDLELGYPAWQALSRDNMMYQFKKRPTPLYSGKLTGNCIEKTFEIQESTGSYCAVLIGKNDKDIGVSIDETRGRTHGGNLTGWTADCSTLSSGEHTVTFVGALDETKKIIGSMDGNAAVYVSARPISKTDYEWMGEQLDSIQ